MERNSSGIALSDGVAGAVEHGQLRVPGADRSLDAELHADAVMSRVRQIARADRWIVGEVSRLVIAAGKFAAPRQGSPECLHAGEPCLETRTVDALLKLSSQGVATAGDLEAHRQALGGVSGIAPRLWWYVSGGAGGGGS